ncbi:MAG: UDP-3-O-(3-hydroxymyristoyl)glucosamine N-acyltransferase [Armatimonadetes bacterium CG_4_10_14_3_um_filter_66_18]|nr:UDP-3-O-(3-hydroxymyristoyl)glucosamine N-acyltransferase [Armatimonadota bacterium]OIP11770.1 MAG: UDP-3-O-(3-hydroxymyristoyl)glucosamine N-acyltransferase [Armatimonadetes bacterium CG2_30_66_41]PIU93984.1 MAG: UDP-3-O-(3-hydroxymyristoyl)glucosamine N-acyltransferase [Armatimonadetes bacterium CG06_land_8_20_14_3_00_66_21]PIX49011.1 MAG: UDP-3-O-(3-hydroxymyristoyl)glucosamine N-acyltransferase [Armatimonadetes bacterium CG_4_8_14_3_um_filter_66_20]PIY36930.1 MAG: UDP-3-O-(3-hydroxymyris
MQSGFATTLGDLANHVGGELVGDASLLLSGIADVDHARHGDVVFVESERVLPQAENGEASAVLLPPALSSRKPFVRTGTPRLAFARAMELFAPPRPQCSGIHPSATVGKGVTLGDGVWIGPQAVLGDNVTIGARARIGPQCYVGDRASVGDDSQIHPGVYLYHDVRVGKRVIIHSGTVLGADGFGYIKEMSPPYKVPQLGTVEVEDDVELGANVMVDRATLGVTRIGAGSKIDNLVQIAHNVQVGRNCLICAQTGISGSTVLEDSIILGGQVGVGDHLTIGQGTVVGAQGGVISDLAPGSFVSGYPAGPHREKMKVEAAIKRVPDLLRTIRQLMQRVEELDAELGTLREERDG